MNPYYEPGTVNPLTRARAAILNAEFEKLGLAFDELHTDLNDFGTATSASPILIGVGTKTFDITGGHFIQIGQQIAIVSTALPVTHYMVGIVTDYDSDTGEAEAEISQSAGAGTLADWSISITPRGFFTAIQGLTGVQTVPQIKDGLDIAAVTSALFNLKSPLASPAFTGVPTAPSATRDTATTQIATTAFVRANSDWTQIATANAAGLNAVTFSSIPTHYRELLIVGEGLYTPGAVGAAILISSDGVTFSTGGVIHQTSTSAGSPSYMSGLFHAARLPVAPVSSGSLPNAGNQATGQSVTDQPINQRRSVGGISAIRAILNSGNHTGGTYTLYGKG